MSIKNLNNNLPANNLIPPQTLANGLFCPRCNASKIVKNGTYKTAQLYRCKDCGKTFRSTNGTILLGIHKREQFRAYALCIQDGMTIRQAAKQIGISVPTSFAWRHKYLASLTNPEPDKLLPLFSAGIVQTKYSEKGNRMRKDVPTANVKSLLVVDSSGKIILTPVNDPRSASKNINSRILSQTQAIIDPSRFLKSIFRKTNITVLNGNSGIRKYMSAHVSKLKDSLETWMSRFRGVATKYLQSYWEWFCQRQFGDVIDSALGNCFVRNGALAIYKHRKSMQTSRV